MKEKIESRYWQNERKTARKNEMKTRIHMSFLMFDILLRVLKPLSTPPGLFYACAIYSVS